MDREWLALAERAARSAGRFLANSPRRNAALISETARDIKLQADRAAEDRIVTILTAGSRMPIMAEERAADLLDVPTSGARWIVDPLDGTMNYLLGIPFCCVSIALWMDDDPQVAAVYDFDRDEMFSSVAGEGAWVNGASVRVRSVQAEKAVICTGFPAGTDFAPAALSRFVSQVGAFRKVRMLGSAALSLAYVAAGRADVYYERDIRIWDVAAGLGLVRAAGGEFVCASSPVPHALTVYAHNGDCPWPEPTFE
jgi:myo-inositol-1(or 4)-monophosphatase